jgi:hypothetical protein
MVLFLVGIKMQLNDIAPELIIKKKIYRRLVFYGLVLAFLSIIFINTIILGFNAIDYSAIFSSIISSIILFFIFAVIFVKNVNTLRHFNERILTRKVTCPICDRTYIAHKKAIRELNETIASNPELEIDPKILACCECFSKLLQEETENE